MHVVLLVEALSADQHKHATVYLVQIVNVSMVIVTENTILVVLLVTDRHVAQMLVAEIYQYLQISVWIRITMENMMHVAFSEQDLSVLLHSPVLVYQQLCEIQ